MAARGPSRIAASAAALRSLSLEDLRLLALLLQEGSVTRAAERSGQPQPAVSRKLQRLRAVLGDPLLVRSGSGLAPTERAAALREPLREIEAQAGRLQAATDFDPTTSDRAFARYLRLRHAPLRRALRGDAADRAVESSHRTAADALLPTLARAGAHERRQPLAARADQRSRARRGGDGLSRTRHGTKPSRARDERRSKPPRARHAVTEGRRRQLPWRRGHAGHGPRMASGECHPFLDCAQSSESPPP